MTHEYRIVVGARVIRGVGQPDATAIAWAGDTILAIGSDEEVRAISRGDSHVDRLADAFVVPVTSGPDPQPDPGGVLDVGGVASFAIMTKDPRLASEAGDDSSIVGIVAQGRVVRGSLVRRFD